MFDLLSHLWFSVWHFSCADSIIVPHAFFLVKDFYLFFMTFFLFLQVF
ncbi:hypothetical protein HMPREF0072_0644, partial [Anaerococcus lactolyticus ATCC 51172]